MPGVGQSVELCHACMHMCTCACVCVCVVHGKYEGQGIRSLKKWQIEIEAIDKYSPSSAETIAWISKTKLWHAFCPSNGPFFSLLTAEQSSSFYKLKARPEHVYSNLGLTASRNKSKFT